jgi:uncharacterized protein (DUF3820 family)
MRMPFDKFKGQYVYELSVDYLVWLSKNVQFHGDLDAAVDAAVKEALSYMANPTTPAPRPSQLAPRAPPPVAPAKPKRA